MSFGDLKSESGVKALNDFLADKSYIEGYAPTTSDSAIYAQLASAPESFPHALRWYKHVTSFAPNEVKAFGAGNIVAESAPVQAKAPAPADDDDDDFGFSDDDEDDEEETPAEKAKREKMEAMAKAKAEEKAKSEKKKKEIIAKSEVTLDVKPWDDETCMVKLEECVRSIQMDGLVWGFSKLVAVGYGIKKLRIVCVVEDEKVSTDDIEDQIVGFGDYVQSMDIHAFNKI